MPSSNSRTKENGSERTMLQTILVAGLVRGSGGTRSTVCCGHSFLARQMMLREILARSCRLWSSTFPVISRIHLVSETALGIAAIAKDAFVSRASLEEFQEQVAMFRACSAGTSEGDVLCMMVDPAL